MFEEIVNKILDLLKSDEQLAIKVRKWYFGFPRNPTQYPYIAVRFKGCRVEVETYFKRHFEMVFEILASDASLKEDEAEKNVINLVEKIDMVLTENYTLNGLVDNSLVNEVVFESSTLERGETVVEALIMLTCSKTQT